MCIPSFKILAITVPEKTVTQKNLTELQSYVITELRTDQIQYSPTFGAIIKHEQKAKRAAGIEGQVATMLKSHTREMDTTDTAAMKRYKKKKKKKKKNN